MKDVLDWFIREYGRNGEREGDMVRILFLAFRSVEMLTVSLELDKRNSRLETSDLEMVIIHNENLLKLIKGVRGDILAIAKFRIEEVEYEEFTTRENITEAAKKKGMNEKDYLEFIFDNSSTVKRKAGEVDAKVRYLLDRLVTRFETNIIRLKALLPSNDTLI